MDYVKQEDQNENCFKEYIDTMPKSRAMDPNDYHVPFSLEHLQQAMSLSAGNIMHNLQLPLSPKQMSSILLKAHPPQNITDSALQRPDIGAVHNLVQELSQNINQEEVSLNLIKSLSNESELHSNILISSEDMARNIALFGQHMPPSDAFPINRANPLNEHLSELCLVQQNDLGLLRQSFTDCHNDSRRIPVIMTDNAAEQNLTNRLDQELARLGHHPEYKLETKLGRFRDPTESGIPESNSVVAPQFPIKSEQEDDAYYYERINDSHNNIDVIQEQTAIQQVPQALTTQNEGATYFYNTQTVLPVQNADLYRQQYIQYYDTDTLKEPQNLVVHDLSAYAQGNAEILKAHEQNPTKRLSPKPPEPVKYNYNQDMFDDVSRNENDPSLPNKMVEDAEILKAKLSNLCYSCNKTFPSKKSLKQHIRICLENCVMDPAEKINKFTCSQCAYVCQSPAILKIHERKHTGEKPFSCSLCDYRSGQKNNVAKHILVHMKEKPYKCQYCEYKCAQKNNLVVHERTHTGHKPFACPYCNYRTVQKPNLVKHMYLHTDQKPFACDLCSYRCVQKTNLTKHRQRHLNGRVAEEVPRVGKVQKQYKPRSKTERCQFCDYACVQKASLVKHIHYKHPQVNNYTRSVDLMSERDICEELVQNLSLRKPPESVVAPQIDEPITVKTQDLEAVHL